MTEHVPIGHMRLYSHMRPGLLAGSYRVALDQDFASSSRPVDTVTKHVEVTAPRFALAGGEVHSVFPPNNSVGPFHNQLPHIALKRRTLPWERTGDPDGDADGEPWLALVILSDGEANFMRNVSVKDVLPSDLHGDVPDDARCDAVEVTRSTVEKVFPGRDEFEFLLHVRQVNVNDTEHAGNDEDGFMAVAMANRLPQQGTNYGAYLISVEHRAEELPTAAGLGVDDRVGGRSVYDLDDAQLYEASYSGGATGHRVDLGASTQPTPKGTLGAVVAEGVARSPRADLGADVTETRTSGWHGPSVVGRQIDLGSGPTRAGRVRDAGAARAAAVEADLSNRSAASARSTRSAASTVTAHSTMTVINDMVLDMVEPGAELVRFPVLAHWQFSCSEGFDFAELMINLDVGMIGHQPDAATAPSPASVTVAGHVLIDNLTRAGERVPAWYRGPCTPRQIQRRARPVPFHSADQARSLGGDFREQLGEAAAFEVGRMLALADPAFLQALLRWRRDGFQRLKTASIQESTGIADLLGGLDVGGGRALARDLFVHLADKELAGLGPLIDPLGGLRLSDDDVTLISAGLRTPVGRVRDALGLGNELTTPGVKPGTLPSPGVTSFDELVQSAGTELAHLGDDLDARVAALSDDARPRDRKVER